MDGDRDPVGLDVEIVRPLHGTREVQADLDATEASRHAHELDATATDACIPEWKAHRGVREVDRQSRWIVETIRIRVERRADQWNLDLRRAAVADLDALGGSCRDVGAVGLDRRS